VNRWRQRLAEINSIETLTHPERDVQNVQNVRNGRPIRHSVQIEQIEHRAESCATLDGGALNDWRGCIGELRSRPCPDGFAPQRWAVLCNGVAHFARQWATQAVSLGWTFDELFALAEPFANVSLQGDAWFVGDSKVTALTADSMTLRTEGGATQRIYRKRPQL
jgi:hypothetical protein